MSYIKSFNALSWDWSGAGAFPRRVSNVFLIGWGLAQYCEEADNLSKQTYTLDEGRGKDHVTTDVVAGAGLTRNGFNCFSCELANAEACTNSGETCTDSNTCNSFHVSIV